MNASIVDLRYKMSEVLDALARRECVTIFYHGKVKGGYHLCRGKVQVEGVKASLFRYGLW